jgi:hypothetical protein
MNVWQKKLVGMQLVFVVIVVGVLATGCSVAVQPVAPDQAAAVEVAPVDASSRPGYNATTDGRLIKAQLEQAAHKTTGSSNPAAVERSAATGVTPIDGRDLKEQLEREALIGVGFEDQAVVAAPALPVRPMDGRDLKEQLEREALIGVGR